MNQIHMSQQVSNYRLKRIQQQKELERLRQLEVRERYEMDQRLMDERKVYLETKDNLKRLRTKCKKLKRKNVRERKTQKQIDFLINQDF